MLPQTRRVRQRAPDDVGENKSNDEAQTRAAYPSYFDPLLLSPKLPPPLNLSSNLFSAEAAGAVVHVLLRV